MKFSLGMKIALYALAAGAVIWLLAMPIKSVKVNDDRNNVAASVVVTKIRPMLSYGWFCTDLNDMAEVLKQIPWVDKVDIVRLAPFDLEIKITEKKPVARWKDNALVSDGGNIFFISDNGKFKHLPRLEAELVEANDAVTAYFVLGQYLSLSANKELKGLKSITCGEVYGCKIIFGNKLILKIGAENIAGKIQKFFHVLPKIKAKNRHKMPRSVDMRYANGAAVS